MPISLEKYVTVTLVAHFAQYVGGIWSPLGIVVHNL
jgi:hypothetical protein